MRNAVPGSATGPADATVRNAKNAVYVVFIAFGFASAAWAAQIPQVRSALQVSPGVLGLILLCSAIGPAVAIPLTGLAIQRFGEALVVAASGIIAGAGLASWRWATGTASPRRRPGCSSTASARLGDVAMNVQGTVRASARWAGRSCPSSTRVEHRHRGRAGVGTIMVAWHIPVTADLLGTGVVVGLTIAWPPGAS